MTATPTLLAILEMEQVVDDLDGISNALSRGAGWDAGQWAGGHDK